MHPKNKLIFLLLALLVEYIFLTTFYGLYFNYQLHITITISSSSYMSDGDLLWAAFMYCIYTCLSDLWVLRLNSKIALALLGFELGSSGHKAADLPMIQLALIRTNYFSLFILLKSYIGDKNVKLKYWFLLFTSTCY